MAIELNTPSYSLYRAERMVPLVAGTTVAAGFYIYCTKMVAYNRNAVLIHTIALIAICAPHVFLPDYKVNHIFRCHMISMALTIPSALLMKTIIFQQLAQDKYKAALLSGFIQILIMPGIAAIVRKCKVALISRSLNSRTDRTDFEFVNRAYTSIMSLAYVEDRKVLKSQFNSHLVNLFDRLLLGNHLSTDLSELQALYSTFRSELERAIPGVSVSESIAELITDRFRDITNPALKHKAIELTCALKYSNQMLCALKEIVNVDPKSIPHIYKHCLQRNDLDFSQLDDIYLILCQSKAYDLEELIRIQKSIILDETPEEAKWTIILNYFAPEHIQTLLDSFCSNPDDHDKFIQEICLNYLLQNAPDENTISIVKKIKSPDLKVPLLTTIAHTKPEYLKDIYTYCLTLPSTSNGILDDLHLMVCVSDDVYSSEQCLKILDLIHHKHHKQLANLNLILKKSNDPETFTQELEQNWNDIRKISMKLERDPNFISFKNALINELYASLLDKCKSTFGKFGQMENAISGLVQLTDYYRQNVCYTFSLLLSLRTKAELIAKGISDPSIQVEALTTLAHNAPEKAQDLLNYCQSLSVEAECLEKLQFLVDKQNVSDNDVLVPPTSCDISDIERTVWEDIRKLYDSSMARNQLHKRIKLITINNRCRSILRIKKIIGKGGEREVKLAYNLRTGEFYARKPLPGIEQIVLKELQKAPSEGLPKVVGYYRNSKGKELIVQPCFDIDLSKAINDKLLNSIQKKYFVIEKFLLALSNLHQHKLEGLPDPLGFLYSPLPPLPINHGDIKPANIVINRDTLELMLIDFGCSISIFSFACGTLAYMDPHKLKSMLQSTQLSVDDAGTSSKARDYHYNYGQRNDVWSAGIVIAEILFGSLFDRNNTSLHFINVCSCMASTQAIIDRIGPARPTSNYQKYFADAMSKITQDQVNACLDSNGSELLIPLLKRMLTVDADQRCTSEEALAMFGELTSTV